ncbi:phosphatase [Williamsoniiplasma somnilux]|uniref:Phosphatase n=1 Tax=Williamsoniiplasma somnilux TaxID=215578 RepID=A0A2K8NZ67_9MOLU|nr:HAD-IIB family hydrolase [Williamsoniiplasma somnilux]ATZ18508.1 phosphatase [Williamsoniiplasma somnilux]
MKLKDLDKKRLILVDLDGTTLKNDGESIHPKTKKALLKAKDAGHIVCIVTGRPFRAMANIYRELKLDTILANFDGAHISDPSKREFKRIVLSVNYDIIREIINEPTIKDSVENIVFEYYDKVLIWKEDAKLDAFFHISDIKQSVYDQLIVGDPWTLWNGPSTNIVLKLKGDKYTNRVIRALAKFQDAVQIQSDILYGVKNSDEKPVITLTNKIASKGFAADIIAQYYNKDIRDVIAFGDQLNDFAMLQKVGIGIAMRNGNESLKFVSNGITHHTNDEGGVGEYLDALLSGKEI